MNQTEEVLAQFFDKDAITEATRRIYRVSRSGDRLYYVTDPRVIVGPGVTTVIKSQAPMSPWLMKWIAEHGTKRAEYLRDSRAAYGTLMHMLFARTLIAGEFAVDAIPQLIAEHFEKEKLSFDTTGWAEDLAQDLVGFAGWVRDYNVKPIAIEYPMFDDEDKVGGTADLPCELDRYVKDPKSKKWIVAGRETAYVDYKSNRESFYDESAIQGHQYRRMWNKLHPGKPLERVFLYGPKDWDESSKERYRFSDVTDHPKRDRFATYLRWYHEERSNPGRTRIAGTVSLTADPNQNVTFLSLEDFLQKEVA